MLQATLGDSANWHRGDWSAPRYGKTPNYLAANNSYDYPGAGSLSPWLKNCSFVVKAGECLAITGPSGCGKSTLVRLMLGLLDPHEGRVCVGGIDIRTLGKRVYRDMLASVLQDDTMLAGSVCENISFFDEEATTVTVERAARLAELHEDIVAMPMGYFSLVGDMGSALSGGQKQRLLLARALYRDPSILVLDEGTSHLDLKRERSIVKTLRQLKVTRVLIAHRTETIAGADRVLRMEKIASATNEPTRFHIEVNELEV